MENQQGKTREEKAGKDAQDQKKGRPGEQVGQHRDDKVDQGSQHRDDKKVGENEPTRVTGQK